MQGLLDPCCGMLVLAVIASIVRRLVAKRKQSSLEVER